MDAPRWAEGMKQLGPGMYLDADAILHCDGAQLCAHLNVTPTQEYRELACLFVSMAFVTKFPRGVFRTCVGPTSSEECDGRN